MNNFGAYPLASSITHVALKWLTILFVFAFTVVVISSLNCFVREFKQIGSVTKESLLVFLMSALLAFISASKVFSPQYVGWLLPFSPFLRMRQIILVVVIFVMTIVIHLITYDRLLAL